MSREREAEAIAQRYARRGDPGRYSLLRPEVMHALQERQRALLDHKRRAREHRGVDQLHHASQHCKPFLCKVAERGGNIGFTVAKLLKHLDAYGAEALDAALREAVSQDTAHLGAVRHLLDKNRHEHADPPPLSA